MKVQILSDLHFEFQADHGLSFAKSIQPLADVLVLAGDIFPLCKTPVYLPALHALTEKFADTIYVPGNHDYYDAAREATLYRLSELEERVPRLFVLESGEELWIDGQQFLGGTLWFKFDPMNSVFEKEMEDFSAIPEFREWVYNENQKCSDAIKDRCTEDSVVITHYLPTESVVHPRWKGNSLTRFFVSEETTTLTYKCPKLWIHGHTHDSVDQVVGDTRVVCNPFGYAQLNMLNSDFKEDLVLDLTRDLAPSTFGA